MTNKIKNNQSNQGQIAIIVLLASAILLTLGMSASRKTVTDTKVDTDEELLKEAFNTAESGINNYLLNNNTQYNPGDGNSAVVSSLSIGNANSLTSEGKVSSNTPQLFWLVNHNNDGTIDSVYYSKSTTLSLKVDDTFTGAVKIDYYSRVGTNYSVSRSGYNFSNTAPAVTGYTYSASKTINFPIGTEDALLLVVTPLGSSTNLTLSGSSVFPLQGEELTAVGTAGDGVKTQIKTRNIYQIPSFFFESITAQNAVQ
ncbi:MAG: hypothetical protein PHE32_03450 [Candidatus Shapirobacteria bacterium]|nr:hypothetical protein [Candidatus Shapirobacteria bacterium]